MDATQFQPMSIGQILDRAFRLYRANFVRFLTIVAVIQVPVALISMIIMLWVQSSARTVVETSSNGPQFNSTVIIATVVGGIVFALAVILAQFLSNAALIKNVSASYTGGDVSVGQAYRLVLPRLLTIVLASILVTILVGLGLILLVVPGIIFMFWFTLTTQCIVVENISATRGMKRSKQLVKGNLGKVFGLSFVVALITYVATFLFTSVGRLICAALTEEQVMARTVINQVFSTAANILVMPISAAAMILLYYDFRIRKEGFDLEMLAKSLSQSEPS